MKVKIRRKIFDGKYEPVMVILTKQDKKNIANMAPNATKYCVYPGNYPSEGIRGFMSRDNVDKKTGKANINKKLMSANLKKMLKDMKDSTPKPMSSEQKAYFAGWKNCMEYVLKYPQDEGEIV